ncbi:hypothetical protein RHAL1_01649 [Beijerinckiaceae bacterium RH AL1]|nr:hypothetical protein RHCH11_RHCH11_01612 [Beijerinckiaceae bacterium RH CH11]VVB45284.1 hypothetical protein RHAL8_01608 [Beijerinckiaceae bacterium RH AL8]VVC54749.1 hypothetical protein RHAL1_01649 [Beijerinckiaceae bacterium RH AL1]
MVRRPQAVSNQEAVPPSSPLEPSWFETRCALLTMRGWWALLTMRES